MSEYGAGEPVVRAGRVRVVRSVRSRRARELITSRHVQHRTLWSTGSTMNGEYDYLAIT